MKTVRPTDPSHLTAAVKQEALRLGFQAVGVTSASALDGRNQELTRWISAGFSGTLQYMTTFFKRQERLRQSFPGLKSILVVAARYADHSDNRDSSSRRARVARYAWGRDYHRTIERHLKKLAVFVRTQVEKQPRFLHCVDTSPIQERALAELAGLGFFGKNACLIRPNGGSFFFLAAILTDLELAPDQPIRWDCGACTLCLEACPTGALTEPYQLDARRCISYLTIENKGAIPTELRSQMQDWVFGCDICQEVCPYNRKANQTVWEEFKPASGAGAELPIEELLAIRSDEEFLHRFAGTPLMRAKRSGLLRNAAVVAGNLKVPGLVPVLEEALRQDDSPLVRQHAAWALGQIGTSQAQKTLQSTLQTEGDPAVQAEIGLALAESPVQA